MLQSSKFVFFGTPEFAAIILENLIKAGFIPLAVVCNPDRPAGRKKIITPPPVKVIAGKSGIKVLQPDKIKPEFLEELKSLAADFYIVAAYGVILPQELIDIPRLGVIGVHPSLLPKLRGVAPIQSALLNQEKETGVSLFMIDAEMDHGPILDQEKIIIEPTDNSEKLGQKLAKLSGEALIKLLPDFVENKILAKKQDDSQATFTMRKIKTEMAFIDEKELKVAEEGSEDIARMIDAKIRAFYPEPGAWTIRGGRRLKLLDSKVENGLLRIKKWQWEGKNPESL